MINHITNQALEIIPLVLKWRNNFSLAQLYLDFERVP